MNASRKGRTTARSQLTLASIGLCQPVWALMALSRSDFKANERVQLVSLCYQDAPLATGQPGQLLRPGEYLAKELPDGAFATGLVRKIEQSESEETPKSTTTRAKAEETKSSTEGDK